MGHVMPGRASCLTVRAGGAMITEIFLCVEIPQLIAGFFP
jgi:hypothetical protein